MRISGTMRASLTFAAALAIAGCSSAGTTEEQPGSAGESSSAASTPSPSPSVPATASSPPSPMKNESGTTTQVPSIEVVSQQAEVSDEVASKLESSAAQFADKDSSLTLIPMAGQVETGSVKFAIDSKLPPSCAEVEGEGGSGPCAMTYFMSTTSSDATNGKDVTTGLSFFKLDKDVGKSTLELEIPAGSSKVFAGVIIGDTSSMINVETGQTTKKFGPDLPSSWTSPQSAG